MKRLVFMKSAGSLQSLLHLLVNRVYQKLS